MKPLQSIRSSPETPPVLAARNKGSSQTHCLILGSQKSTTKTTITAQINKSKTSKCVLHVPVYTGSAATDETVFTPPEYTHVKSNLRTTEIDA
jgi:hypothetical protein